MTLDQFKFYALHPLQFLAHKLQRFHVWRLKRRALKQVRAHVADLKQMEVNLRAAADPCCPKCYGQGQRGFNLTLKKWETCRCTYNPRTAQKCEEKAWLQS